MLSFDIETTGLQHTDTITAACVYDPVNNIRKMFIFAVEKDPSEFLDLLDNADILCAFNGARFDIPFIQNQWKLSDERIHKWRLKLFDIYEACLIIFKSGFSLNQLLLANHIEVKTSSGKEAITMAANKQWLELGEYCMHDTIKTYCVSTLPSIMLPLKGSARQVLLNNAGTKYQHFDIVYEK